VTLTPNLGPGVGRWGGAAASTTSRPETTRWSLVTLMARSFRSGETSASIRPRTV